MGYVKAFWCLQGFKLSSWHMLGFLDCILRAGLGRERCSGSQPL